MTSNVPPSPLDSPLAEGEPVSPRQAAQAMIAVQRIRRAEIEEFIRLGKDAAAKRRDAAKKKARTQLQSRQPTVEDRKADAVLASADDVFEAEVAGVLQDACEKAMFLLRDDWDTARSIGANERAEKSVVEGFGS